MASKSAQDSSTNSLQRAVLGFAAVLLVATGVALWFRGGHGTLGEKGHDFTVALFSACNLRDARKIDQIEGMIEAAKAEGSITDSEVKWLMAIVDDTRDNRWDQAAKTLRKLMNVQAVPNRALPDLE